MGTENYDEGQSFTVRAELLTSSSFGQFGSVIEAHPDPDPTPESRNMNVISANQGTALKYADVLSLQNRYSDAPKHTEAEPAVSLFVCSARSLVPSDNAAFEGVYEFSLMEKHPFTTQSFIPLGLDGSDQHSAYLVIVAPTVVTATGESRPAQTAMKAFICRGSQAVTYGPGIWHAPMVALGCRPISFVVIQYTNGVGADDCKEAIIEPARVAVPKNFGLQNQVKNEA